MVDGLTGCNEKVKGFLGRKPVIKNNRAGGITAYFDISFGLNDPASDKFGTWRHCIAYNQNVDLIKNCKPGSYLQLTGWIVTNSVYNEAGVKQIADGKPVTREYLIINAVVILKRENKKQPAQLSLVETGV
jgi:hypothetical protein